MPKPSIAALRHPPIGALACALAFSSTLTNAADPATNTQASQAAQCQGAGEQEADEYSEGLRHEPVDYRFYSCLRR